jgi:hypothetical protein
MRLIKALVLIASLAACVPIAAAETPRQFVERLYAMYGADAKPVVFGEGPQANILTASLSRLIAEDGEAVGNDEVGFLDGDLICDCQDYDEIKLSDLQVRRISSRKAIAIASFHVFDQPRRVRFSLVRNRGVWQIDDVWSGDGPSLRSELQQDIDSHRRTRKGT